MILDLWKVVDLVMFIYTKIVYKYLKKANTRELEEISSF